MFDKLEAFRKDIKVAIEMEQAMRELATRMTSTLSVTPTGKNKNSSRVELYTVKVLHWAQRAAELQADYLLAQMDMAEWIMSYVSDEKQRQILMMRGVEGKPWQDIFDALHLSPRTCFRIYAQGKKALKNALDNYPTPD